MKPTQVKFTSWSAVRGQLSKGILVLVDTPVLVASQGIADSLESAVTQGSLVNQGLVVSLDTQDFLVFQGIAGSVESRVILDSVGLADILGFLESAVIAGSVGFLGIQDLVVSQVFLVTLVFLEHRILGNLGGTFNRLCC